MPSTTAAPRPTKASGRLARAGPLEHRTALVLGPSPGMGATIARALSKEGAHVVVTSADGARTARTRGGGIGHPSDAAAPPPIEQAMEKARRRLGHIDMLVAAGALRDDGDAADMHGSRVLFESQVPPDLVEVWYAARFVARQMAADGHGGSIVVVGEHRGGEPPPGEGAAMPEAALARDLLRRFGWSGVRVNVLARGPRGRSSDLVHVLRMLASDAAAPVTGTTVVVDGDLGGA